MRYSENWLREWVNPNLKIEQLADQLTMSGMEVEEVIPAAEHFTGVIVGKILQIKKHPQAEQLHVCTVDVGVAKTLQIVCGANNVEKNLKVAVALENAMLPHGKKITVTEIQGVQSEGMLCSAMELGLAEKSDGILILPEVAPIGNNVWEVYQLQDRLLNISITPNRGDCLSIRGIAREIGAITQTQLTPPAIPAHEPVINDTIPVNLLADQSCPHYVGRIIRGININVPSPVWLQERLRRSGARSINPIVDVMNYVMFELGQPMHAFDLQTIDKAINVRMAKAKERILLLDGTEKELDSETLIIADKNKPLAIAGVMGGMDSSVTLKTTDIFLESAYFKPQAVARQRQFYNINSEASYRYERFVDATIQREAIERATKLIVEITGGEVGPVIEASATQYLPVSAVVKFSNQDVKNVLGVNIATDVIANILHRLNIMTTASQPEHWEITPPSYRNDIILPEDVIEEIARLYGYDNIPLHEMTGELISSPIAQDNEMKLRQFLSDIGYFEVVTYSFISEKLANLIAPNQKHYTLSNPISADMSIMRPSLLPGLISTWIYNDSRQQHRVRLFEMGICFNLDKDTINETPYLAGLIAGSAYPEQWGVPTRTADFYDLKGDVENCFASLGMREELQFKSYDHPALHPGQSAAIFYQEKMVGFLGALHPNLVNQLDIKSQAFVFEVNLSLLPKELPTKHIDISKFPEVRRDLAFLINQAIPAKEIQDTIKMIVGSWLKDVFIFDVYQGKGIAPGKKSIALALILQDATRTLVDDEVADLMKRVIDTLKGQLGAELRS